MVPDQAHAAVGRRRRHAVSRAIPGTNRSRMEPAKPTKHVRDAMITFPDATITARAGAEVQVHTADFLVAVEGCSRGRAAVAAAARAASGNGQ